MKRVVIIQARMGSTRLPGKVMAEIHGKPMLYHQINRLRKCSFVDEIVIATTTNLADEAIVDCARKYSVRYFQGDENDVLSRFVGAAKENQADVVIRVTADCPLIDPDITDSVIRELTSHRNECDYASNVIKRTYPRGLDVEAFFSDVLFRVDRLASSPLSREHVTVLIYSERKDLFVCRSVIGESDNSDLRWTVDDQKDLTLIRRLYDELSLDHEWRSFIDICKYVRGNPELMTINLGTDTWQPKI